LIGWCLTTTSVHDRILNLNMIQKVLALVHILSININDYFSDFIHLNVSKELLSGFRGHASNFGLKIVVIINTFETSSRKHSRPVW
jgi:hypothetical protein